MKDHDVFAGLKDLGEEHFEKLASDYPALDNSEIREIAEQCERKITMKDNNFNDQIDLVTEVEDYHKIPWYRRPAVLTAASVALVIGIIGVTTTGLLRRTAEPEGDPEMPMIPYVSAPEKTDEPTAPADKEKDEEKDDERGGAPWKPDPTSPAVTESPAPADPDIEGDLVKPDDESPEPGDRDDETPDLPPEDVVKPPAPTEAKAPAETKPPQPTEPAPADPSWMSRFRGCWTVSEDTQPGIDYSGKIIHTFTSTGSGTGGLVFYDAQNNWIVNGMIQLPDVNAPYFPYDRDLYKNMSSISLFEIVDLGGKHIAYIHFESSETLCINDYYGCGEAPHYNKISPEPWLVVNDPFNGTLHPASYPD